jgi:hypothetical protein
VTSHLHTLSYSTAAELLKRSPAHAYLKKVGPRTKPTPQQIEGTIIHALLLGASSGSDVVMVQFDDFRKKEAQAQRDAILAEGKTPMTQKQMLRLTDASVAIRKNIEAQGIVLDGRSEVPLDWTERASNGLEVVCRGKADHVKGVTTYDLKSIECASEDAIARQIYNMAYDVQHAAYLRAFRAKNPTLAGREKFVFIFFELEPPYSVTPVVLDGNGRHIGEQRWQRAIDRWAECVASGKFPHYVDGVKQISLPTWAVVKEDAATDAEFDEEQAA